MPPHLENPEYPLLTRLPDRTMPSSALPAPASIPPDPQFPYRLRNTFRTVDNLAKRDTAILLNNALIDTTSAIPLDVPAHLRASAKTENYLLQSTGPFEQMFDRETLSRFGIIKVAYFPHNTWLVRMKPEMAVRVENFPGTQSVLPFEPYFKLLGPLLELAVQQADIPGIVSLRLTLFRGVEVETLAALQAMGTEYASEGRSPFGSTIVVKAPRSALSAIASLEGVLTVELITPRQLANDLTRVRLGVDNSPSNLMNTNLHGLSGEDILVNINDTGADKTHLDLADRVFSVDTNSLHDANGHGTHVAGIIASSGENSPEIDNVFGSPPDANFHGIAPKAELFVLPVDLTTGSFISDEFLQETAAEYNYVDQSRTNALISNNSWNFINTSEYNTSAASYDAAVRDALPEKEGAQPVLYVFSAGNSGKGNEDGRGGESASILSPATAKNVITVGALESFRYITNGVETGIIDEIETDDTGITVTNQTPVVSQLFLPPTDSTTQVASFSGRGNVGVGIEGEGGRFKPDVTAPGSFIISTRSAGWTSPKHFTDKQLNVISNQIAVPEELTPYTVFLPQGTAEIEITVITNVFSPEVLPRMPIYAQFGSEATTNNLVGYTSVTLTDEESSSLPVHPGILYYSVGNPISEPVPFNIRTIVSVHMENEAYFKELEKLNGSLAPHYRFESGASTAAPAVSGLLALFQEFLRDNGHDPSPALLKALLINGARTAGELYNFQINPIINFQGWGAVYLANSLPFSLTNNLAANLSSNTNATLQFFDQSPTNALTTGEHKSWKLTLNDTNNAARALPLRLSLVWTDPPGNPSAGIKLVNDLDLIVSNTVTSNVFYGNNFVTDGLFTQVTSPSNDLPQLDNVNNVENVFVPPPLGTNYVVSVVARRVNVNAVTDHPNGVVQDFALVVSLGDNSDVEAPFQLEPIEELEADYVEIPSVVAITNSIPRLNDRVGANAPLLSSANGLLEQWRFYIFTNSPPSTNDVGFTNGPNVAFVTFLPPNLGRPRNRDADIDLYVSRNSALTNLSEAAINEAIMGNSAAGIGVSRNQGGTESIIFTNQPLSNNQIYYIGVKSEDHQGGQYALVGISQDKPFDSEDDGVRVLTGVPLNQGIIPDGSPNAPQAGLILALGNPLNGLTIQEVDVQLSLVHEDIGDLIGNLTHNGVSVVLNNHDTSYNLVGATNSLFAFDEWYNDFRAGHARSDGPGSLIDFVGQRGEGVWLMAQVDDALTHTGRVSSLTLRLRPSPLWEEDEEASGNVEPLAFAYYVVDVPTDVSALQIDLAAPDQPLDLYLRRGVLPTLTQFDKRALGTGSGGLSLQLTRTDVPPLRPGRYFVGVYNPNPEPVGFGLSIEFKRELLIDAEQPFFPNELEVAITDDAITRSTIFVPDTRAVADVKVGLRIEHSRVSDLAMHLVSPLGTRVLLAENRGGADTVAWGAGETEEVTFGGFSDDPNDSKEAIKFASPPYAPVDAVHQGRQFSSGFEGVKVGSIFVAGDTFPANAAGDIWEVLSGQAVIVGIDSPAAEGQNYLNLENARVSAVLPIEPGRKVELFYSARSREGHKAPIGRILLNDKRAQTVNGSSDWERNTPIRFTLREEDTRLNLLSLPGRSPMHIDDIQIRDPAAVKFYFPEEALERFDGESAFGEWTLELWDNRAGAANPQPVLNTWQLMLSLAETNFPAITLKNRQCVTNTLPGDETQYYIVDVPRSATFATNWLNSEGDLILLLNQNGIPQGTMPPDNLSTNFNGGGGAVLSLKETTLYDADTNHLAALSDPKLRPGQRYYLGVKNADPNAENEYMLCLQFDQDDVQIITLTNQILFANIIPFTDEGDLQYYRYRADSDVLSLAIEVSPEDGDVDMVAKFGLLPTKLAFDRRSNEAGIAPELIIITNQVPATILPGDYYIGVYNVEPNQTDVSYSIVATETTAPYNIIRLSDGKPLDFTIGDNTAGPNARVKNYFLLSIDNPTISAVRFDLSALTGTADIVVRKGALPSISEYDRIAVGDPERPGSGRIVIRTNAAQPDLSGNWFVAVLNRQVKDLDFSITGTTFVDDVPITTLSNRIWFTNTVVPSIPGEIRELDYYRFVIPSQAIDATFSLEPLVGMSQNVDLYIQREGLPTESASDYFSTQSGSRNEVITLGTGADLPLSPGEWFLAVVNNEERAVTYRIQAVWNPFPGRIIRVVESEIFARGEDICLVWDSVPGVEYIIQGKTRVDEPIWDGLRKVVADTERTTACLPKPKTPPYRFFRVIFFEGEPPPDEGDFLDMELVLSSTNICMTWNAVLETVYTIQAKRLIDETEWTTLTVVSAERSLMEYCLDLPTDFRFFRVSVGDLRPLPVDEFIDTELLIFDDQICLRWFSQVGRNYIIEGKKTLLDENWSELQAVLADSSSSEFCFNLSTPFRFFRVRFGESPIIVPDLIEPAIEVFPDEICLSWPAEIGQRYHIQGSASLVDPVWTSIETVQADTSLVRYCLPKPTAFRFFRIEVVAPPTAFIESVIEISATDLCIHWNSTAGVDYALEGKQSLVDKTWSSIALISATGERSEHCLKLPVALRFFRIREIELTPDGPAFVTPNITLKEMEICFEWPAETGQRFTIQGKESIAATEWSHVGSVSAIGMRGEFCLDRSTMFRFFRIQLERGETPMQPPNEIAGFVDSFIRIDDDELCVEWMLRAGVVYVLQGKEMVDTAEWTAIETVRATGEKASVCLLNTTVMRFFRVAILETVSAR